MELKRPSFFAEMLGGSAAREVKLSRAFSACFAESREFRRAALRLLAVRTDCARLKLDPSAYACRPEVTVQQGRLDLLLESSRPGDPSFCLENKLGAPLTASQVMRYRAVNRRMKIVAVTKRPPEVGHRWLRENRCFALRWQDVHEALAATRGIRGHDRFICLAFRRYLEELDMAHASRLTVEGLHELGRLFRMVRAERQYSAIDGSASFERGAQCVELLEEVVREVLDRRPELGSWRQNGPLYFKWRADGRDFDHVAFRFHRDGLKHWVGGAFEFSQQGGKTRVAWVNQGAIPTIAGEMERRHKVATSTRAVIDAERLIGLFLKDSKRYIGK